MDKAIKKFYTDVSLKEIEDRYVVQLDGRAAKTVGRCLLGASSEKLSQAIADEWRGQEDVIDLSTMPLTKLQGVILDHQDEEDWQNFVLSYLNTDLLCYWSTDEKLAQRQDQTWRPLLERVGQELGASFKTTKTIIAVEQSEALHTAFYQKIKTKSAQEQFCLKLLTEMTGSAV
ncbi:MAG: ATP12 family chaperone protein, partial [Pseudomonadota bacterium]